MWSIRQISYDISAIALTFGGKSLFFKILKTHLGNHCEVFVALMKSPQTLCVMSHKLLGTSRCQGENNPTVTLRLIWGH